MDPLNAQEPREPLTMMSSAVEYDLNMARNKHDEPIDEAAKEQLRALIRMPSIKLWERCRNIVLACPKEDKFITLWRAVCAVDPTYQKKVGPKDAEGNNTWDRLPTPEILESAIAWATH